MPGRDRTAEFIATINSRREKPQWIQERRQQTTNKLAINPQHRALMLQTQNCLPKIIEAIEISQKLAILASKRTVFDDGEANRLIARFRELLKEINTDLDHINNTRDPQQPHMENIVKILQRRVRKMTSDFKSTLEARARSLQKQAARHELFVGPSTSVNVGEPSSSYTYFQNQQQQQQQLLMNDQIDLSERANSAEIIESTIVEIGTAMNQLAQLIHDQGETITRIDMNISETTANVDAAHDALLKYFASINSNRWLILKVFGVLFFFFIIFVVFAS